MACFPGSLGNGVNQIKFPSVTFCDQQYVDYPKIFKDHCFPDPLPIDYIQEHCDLNMTFGYDYDYNYDYYGSGFGFDGNIGHETYHKYLKCCLRFQSTHPTIHLENLRQKLMTFEVQDFIESVHLVNGVGFFPKNDVCIAKLMSSKSYNLYPIFSKLEEATRPRQISIIVSRQSL